MIPDDIPVVADERIRKLYNLKKKARSFDLLICKLVETCADREIIKDTQSRLEKGYGTIWSCNPDINRVNNKIVHLSDKTVDDLRREFNDLEGLFPEGINNLVTLAEAPRLVITPAQPEFTAAVGNPLAFTCKAEVPDPTLITDLKWISPKGLEIGVGDRILTQDISGEGKNGGAPGKQLLFHSVMESDLGRYECRATYAYSTTLRAYVNLIPFHPLKWLEVSEVQYATLDHPFRLRIFPKTNLEPLVSWLKDGVPIQNASERQYLSQSDGILIQNVSREDAGIFTCRAIVDLTGDFSERRICLKIVDPPKFINKIIHKQYASEGKPFLLEFQAVGEPTPTFDYFGPNAERLIEKKGFVICPNTGTIFIDQVKKDDGGDYTCRASNLGGEVEAVVKLVVVSKRLTASSFDDEELESQNGDFHLVNLFDESLVDDHVTKKKKKMVDVDPVTLMKWLTLGLGQTDLTERDMQLVALEQLCMLLLMSDNVDRCFESCPPHSFLPALCRIMLDETSPESILEVTARAITYYLDVSAECARRIVSVEGSIKAICQRMTSVNLESRVSKDLAEQCVKVLELICSHEAGAVFDAGGLQSVLTFIRTAETPIHKDTLHSAMVVVSKLCTKVEPTDASLLPCVESLSSLLRHDDNLPLKGTTSSASSIEEQHPPETQTPGPTHPQSAPPPAKRPSPSPTGSSGSASSQPMSPAIGGLVFGMGVLTCLLITKFFSR